MDVLTQVGLVLMEGEKRLVLATMCLLRTFALVAASISAKAGNVAAIAALVGANIVHGA